MYLAMPHVMTVSQLDVVQTVMIILRHVLHVIAIVAAFVEDNLDAFVLINCPCLNSEDNFYVI